MIRISLSEAKRRCHENLFLCRERRDLEVGRVVSLSRGRSTDTGLRSSNRRAGCRVAAWCPSGARPGAMHRSVQLDAGAVRSSGRAISFRSMLPSQSPCGQANSKYACADGYSAWVCAAGTVPDLVE